MSLWRNKIEMHIWQGIQATLVFFFSENAFFQTYLCLDFSKYALKGFANVLMSIFLNFLFFTIHNYHFTNITNALLVYQWY